MVKTTVDVFVSEELKDNESILTIRSVDLYGTMGEIPMRDLWTLKASKTEQLIALTVEQDIEEFYHPSIGLAETIAKKLKLKNGYRYELNYDELDRTMRLKKMPVSGGTFPLVVSNGIRRGTLHVGFRAHGILGLPLAQKAVLCRKNDVQMKLVVKVSKNMSEGDALVMHEDTARQFDLIGGLRYNVVYNQTEKELAFSEARVPLSFA